MNLSQKIATTSALGLMIFGTSALVMPTSQAFWGGDKNGERPQFENLTAEQKAIFEKRMQNGKGRGVPKMMDHVGRSENTDITVVKISNGITTTITSEDPEVVAKLQAREPRSGKNNVTVTKIDITNGIQVTITSDDAEIVRKMHERADRKANRENITKAVENLDNGVKITVTGSTSEAIAAILEREEKLGHNNDEITKTRTELSNGVQVTITSENADLVTRIQKRAELGNRGKRGGKRGHFKGNSLTSENAE